jgi:hypothetical protein
MARRAFLHIGTAKSGTTYLQELWWRHRATLADRGLLLPGEALRDHFHAAAVLKGMTAVVAELDEHARGAWTRVLADTAAWSGDVLVSHEHFSDTPAETASRALRDLAEASDEVHLLLTVRDLGRVLPSAWQQRVKQGARQRYLAFLTTVRRHEPDQKFWRYQDVGAILDRWAADLPPERVHLVVVPGPGTDRDELWRRTARVLGVDVDDLDTSSQRPNDSLGVIESELLRRVNRTIAPSDHSVALARYTKGDFARQVLAGSAPKVPFTIPGEHAEWVREETARTIEALQRRPYDVVGDLDDLRTVAIPDGRVPEDVTDGEVLSAASVLVARMIEQEP